MNSYDLQPIREEGHRCYTPLPLNKKNLDVRETYLQKLVLTIQILRIMQYVNTMYCSYYLNLYRVTYSV
jgi:hypothetical protein